MIIDISSLIDMFALPSAYLTGLATRPTVRAVTRTIDTVGSLAAFFLWVKGTSKATRIISLLIAVSFVAFLASCSNVRTTPSGGIAQTDDPFGAEHCSEEVEALTSRTKELVSCESTHKKYFLFPDGSAKECQPYRDDWVSAKAIYDLCTDRVQKDQILTSPFNTTRGRLYE